MIYIISEEIDLVTDLVEEWFISANRTYIRYNAEDFYEYSFNLNNDSNIDVSILWQRRGKFNLLPTTLFKSYPNRSEIIRYIDKEADDIVFTIEILLKKKLGDKYIGSYYLELNNNKLINLLKAKESGFFVPETLVTTKKTDLLNFKKQHDLIITKDIKSAVKISTNRKRYVSTGVKLVNNMMVDKLNTNFAPILLQEYIEKKYEIRVFVFLRKIFSMAIFSQNDLKTSIDFRNYNYEKPNRNVPVKLPFNIEKKILAFMDSIKLNTGSMDLIITPKNNYYFLEINPMGQFHWLSENCNFYVEKYIANHLLNG